MNSNKQTEKQLPTVQELGALIMERAKAAEKILTAGIKLPDAHAWRIPDDALSFWDGCPVRSTEGMGFSLYIDRQLVPGMSADEIYGDQATIRAEIRLFMPTAEYRHSRKICRYRHSLDVRFAAHLWVETGPHWAFQSTTHLVDNERFVYADTLEALCAAIVDRVNTSLSRAVQCVARKRIETAEDACA
ncbi:MULTISPECIES: hypothetical protein [Pandoraea]|uniref:Uncharacterized protein n=2 Tax=Pandoraea TaxID=93217 RepID=A0A5E4XEZ6_9BURK|nr:MULTISPECIES: hypothetical protein [Pandoraea]VVE16985.1 hypothetical protein PCE31107_02947 [Pandoraea cepalis]VVE34782.1 hypothetical protein PTE31013_03867 [Pandoraea terrigena]